MFPPKGALQDPRGLIGLGSPGAFPQKGPFGTLGGSGSLGGPSTTKPCCILGVPEDPWALQGPHLKAQVIAVSLKAAQKKINCPYLFHRKQRQESV